MTTSALILQKDKGSSSAERKKQKTSKDPDEPAAQRNPIRTDLDEEIDELIIDTAASSQEEQEGEATRGRKKKTKKAHSKERIDVSDKSDDSDL